MRAARILSGACLTVAVLSAACASGTSSRLEGRRPASSITEIRYEPNRDGETRLGSGPYGGVIHIRTGRAG